MREAAGFRLACALPALGYLSTLAVLSSSVIADGYDGIGFALALERFDLARFEPHPPGYPLFVLLGRALYRLGVRPGVALAAVSALGLGLGLGAVAALLRRQCGRAAGWWFLLLAPPSLLCYGLGVAALSDGAGLGVLLLGGWLLAAGLSGSAAAARLRLVAAGACAGLALGIRPPLVPLLGLGLGWLLLETRATRPGGPGGRRLSPLFVGLMVSTFAWLLPLVLLVGPAQLLGLYQSHVGGHFRSFGGSALGLGDLGAPLALVAGLGSALGPLGVALLAAAAIGLAAAPLPPPERRLMRGLLGLFAAYGGWVLLALPLRGHGRHLLPLVVLGSMLVAVGLSRLPWQLAARFRPPVLAVLVFLAVAQALLSGRAVVAFRSSLPPGAALSRLVVEREPRPLLYGARAARYLDMYLGSGSARPALYLGEVIVDLERRDHLPRSVLLTSEVEASAASQPRLHRLARFCYPDAVPRLLRFDAAPIPAAWKAGNRERLDGSCVDLLSYEVGP